jgi:hypothetical protein
MSVLNQDFFSFFDFEEDVIKTVFNASKKNPYVLELLHAENIPISGGKPPIIPPMGTTRYITNKDNSTDWSLIILIVLIIILLGIIFYRVWEYQKEVKEKDEREAREWENLLATSNS